MAVHEYDEQPINPTDTTAYLICSIVLLIIGAFGNMLLIILVLCVKKFRTIHNAFIFNLVIADSLALILLEGFGSASFVHGKSPLANDARLCKVVSYFCLSAGIGSVWSVAACGLHIYIRVCHKAFFEIIYTPQIVMVIIFWLWTLCPMIVLPSMMGWGNHNLDPRLMHCTYNPSESSSFTFFMLTIGVWAPLSITIFCLARVVFVLRSRSADPRQQVPEINGALERELHPPPRYIVLQDERKTLWSVMGVSICMVITWMTMSIIWLRDPRNSFGDAQFLFAMVLAHSPVCLNGIVYAMLNKDFRNAYWTLLTFWRGCEFGELEVQGTANQLELRAVPADSHSNSSLHSNSRKHVMVPTLPGAVPHSSANQLSTSPSVNTNCSVAIETIDGHDYTRNLYHAIGNLRQEDTLTEID
ncbi:melatonin receptor type 1B-B-like [Amphiura filiformis]|uniref:melatonin receptor type 1B-B-like n=1 Tax=Amphiura filiformis TaxID=82378 RepID=UPI003B226756